MPKKEKKQQSLLDFPSLRRHCSVSTSVEWITIDDDTDPENEIYCDVKIDDYKKESDEKSSTCFASIGAASVDVSGVADMASFTKGSSFPIAKDILDTKAVTNAKDSMDITNCTGNSVNCPVCKVNLAPFAMNLRITHVEHCLVNPANETKLSNEKKHRNFSDLSDLPSRKLAKKPLADIQAQRAKYVNSSKVTKRQRNKPVRAEAEASVLRELLPSARTRTIPELKILRFYATPSQEYSVSVDAFNYKPHETIVQYFLSHFHSDHYGGITKRWSLERTIDSKIIYCSAITGRLLTIKFKVDPMFIFSMENDIRYKVYCYLNGELINGGVESKDLSPGLYVTSIDANHCPGAVIFLFESIPYSGDTTHYLHCGDFRINANMLNHPLLQPFHLGGSRKLAKVYLDTTYMNPSYNFPKQEDVCRAVSTLIQDITLGKEMVKQSFGKSVQSRITQFLPLKEKLNPKKCLVLVGTYLIGKERIATSILKVLGNCPIYVSNINSRGDKSDIIRAFHDEYIDSVLTTDPLGLNHHQAVIHLVPMKIVGTLKELANYFNFNKYHDTFERCVGLRPTGWTFQNDHEEAKLQDMEFLKNDMPLSNPFSNSLSDPQFDSVIRLIKNTKRYSSSDILKENPYTAKKYAKFDVSTFRIFSLPYSEHLSFRELCFLVVFLQIGQVIPTVNTHNADSAQRMDDIIEQWGKLRTKLLRMINENKNPDLQKNLQNSQYPGLSLQSLPVSLDDF